MLKIRLQRTGKKHDAAFRIVVAENTSPVKWRFREKIWTFVARRLDKTFSLNSERAKYWLSVWACPTDRVALILVKNWIESAQKFVKERKSKPKKVVENDQNKDNKSTE